MCTTQLTVTFIFFLFILDNPYFDFQDMIDTNGHCENIFSWGLIVCVFILKRKAEVVFKLSHLSMYTTLALDSVVKSSEYNY